MFPVETLPAQYYEERAAASEAARRLAQQQQEAASAAQTAPSKPPTTTPQQTSHPSTPSPPNGMMNTTTPPLPRPGSSSVLGSIFQGFANAKRASSATPSGTTTPSRTQTPIVDAAMQGKSQSQGLVASSGSGGDEKERRDREVEERVGNYDRYCVPSWH